MKDKKNRPTSWFKGVLSNRNESEHLHNHREELILENDDNEEVHSSIDEGLEKDSLNDSMKNNLLFFKENQDKVSLDIVVAVENLLNDRQLVLYKTNGLEEQLQNANETIMRLKNELTKKEQMILEKDKEMRALEGQLTSKQMNYDQVLEDYKDYQNTSNNSFENLKYQLEKEVSKYSKLDEEFTKFKYQNIQKIKELEDQIRNLEVENHNISKQYEDIFEEKSQLVETINDFTDRMSFSFSQVDKSKSNVPPTSSK
ncbi:hypothetical protein [Bacillus sp. FJAT-29790]|uniref:hypothetical protein n=1 Tax=Bacillus sp. FJAT-29790 TaxID=1895002 RepID=UPI0020B41944|nr:hypothetical protein [Bacillus sp. FJAT-29790]